MFCSFSCKNKAFTFYLTSVNYVNTVSHDLKSVFKLTIRGNNKIDNIQVSTYLNFNLVCRNKHGSGVPSIVCREKILKSVTESKKKITPNVF